MTELTPYLMPITYLIFAVSIINVFVNILYGEKMSLKISITISMVIMFIACMWGLITQYVYTAEIMNDFQETIQLLDNLAKKM